MIPASIAPSVHRAQPMSPSSREPRTTAQPPPTSRARNRAKPITPPSLRTVIGLLWEITTRTRRCSTGVSVSSNRVWKPPRPAPTTGSSRQMVSPPRIRSKRPSLTRSRRSESVRAWRTGPLVAIAMPPASTTRTAPATSARRGPNARIASSTRPTISISALERE